MPRRPRRPEGYSASQRELVRATCLYLATRLGDLLDEIVIVGGLVPSLLIDPGDGEPHVGTMDLDVGLGLSLLETGRYKEVAARLREAGFEPDKNERGAATAQRWSVEDRSRRRSTVDFLIAPSRASDRGGRLRNLESDFAALIAPGLDLAFADRVAVELAGRTVHGDRATRRVWVCGPAAFVVLKALAFDGRGKEKDAYDLFYVVHRFGRGAEDIAARLAPFRGEAVVSQALGVLARDFGNLDAVGPRAVARFVRSADDEDLQADVVSAVAALMRLTTT
jgi:hypothetical protein